MKNNIKVLVVALFISISQGYAAYDFSSVTNLINDSISKVGPSCGILITRNDSVIYKKYFGFWSDATYQPIASGSKLPSMAVIMSLVDQGLMSLDDTVQHYLPSFSGKPIITLRQLMSHTSGLPGNSSYISDNSITLQQAVDSVGLRTSMTSYAPGTSFQYGGVSMHVAGRMAEIATGKSWDVLFNEKFGTPMALAHTDYIGLGATTNYRIAGGMGTTMPDYGKIINMFYHYGYHNGVQLIDTASIIAMESDQTNGVPLVNTPYAGDPLREDFRYGFGTWLEKVNPNNNKAIQIGDQGALGFTPWVDRCRNMTVVFYVKKSLGGIQPTHTKLRQLIEQIVPIAIPKPIITKVVSQLKSSAATSNQWFLNDNIIPGAVNQFYTPTVSGNYTVRVANFGGCDVTSDAFNFILTSNTTCLGGQNLEIYPNPTTGKIKITLPTTSVTNITLNNQVGMRVKSFLMENEKGEIDLSAFENGVYFLTIQNELGAVTKKLVLRK